MLMMRLWLRILHGLKVSLAINPQLQALNRSQKEDLQEILIKLAEEVKAYESSLVKGCVADEVGSASFIPMAAYS